MSRDWWRHRVEEVESVKLMDCRKITEDSLLFLGNFCGGTLREIDLDNAGEFSKLFFFYIFNKNFLWNFPEILWENSENFQVKLCQYIPWLIYSWDAPTSLASTSVFWIETSSVMRWSWNSADIASHFPTWPSRVNCVPINVRIMTSSCHLDINVMISCFQNDVVSWHADVVTTCQMAEIWQLLRPSRHWKD